MLTLAKEMAGEDSGGVSPTQKENYESILKMTQNSKTRYAKQVAELKK